MNRNTSILLSLAAVFAMGCDQDGDGTSDEYDCAPDNADIHPGAEEVCDGIDNNCDGSVDDGMLLYFYGDADADGFGNHGLRIEACEAPEGYLADNTDCDDTDATVYPGASEVCDDIDNDCDNLVDDSDPDVDLSTAGTFYADHDGDTYGAGPGVESCSTPVGFVDNADDCDDDNGDAYPGNTETWYDGVDGDCGGEDDYDADADGEAPYDQGGTDCDDTDSATNQAAGNCRASCTPPSATTLTTYDPSGVTDLQFDEDCLAYLTTVISGTDYIYAISSTGTETVHNGTSNHDIGSVAVDPSGTGYFAVSYNNVGYLGVNTGTGTPVVATGGYRKGSNWNNPYLNTSASSMAWDDNGCIWMPNFSALGSVDCFDGAGAYSTLATLGGYVESVALDPHDTLFVSVDAEVIELDSSGNSTVYYDVGDTIHDMVFDITGELYVVTDAGNIVVIDHSGGSHSTYATVAGQGKLAISPDGTLFYVESNPVSPASYTSWSL